MDADNADWAQRRHVAKAAAKKDAWNNLFAAKPDLLLHLPILLS